MTSLLCVKDLTAGYGGVPVIENIQLELSKQEIAVVLGPNGAGKSTLLKSIFALTDISKGAGLFRR